MDWNTKILFYRQLSVLLKSGFPLLQALVTLQSQVRMPVLRRVATHLHARLSAGESLAGAARLIPSGFTPLESSVFRVGETSGTLPEIFERLGQYFEFLARVRSRMISGLVYPAFLLHAAIVIPAVPLLFLRGMGAFLRAVLPALALVYGIAFGIAFLRRGAARSSALGRLFDRIILRVPVFGQLAQTAAMLRFLQAFVCLYSAGVGMLEAVPLAAGTMGNVEMEQEMARCVPLLKSSRTLYETFSINRFFSPALLEMVRTGEISGSMDETLQRSIGYMEQEMTATADRVATILPVIVYLIIAAYVAYIIISFYAGYLGQINSLLGE